MSSDDLFVTLGEPPRVALIVGTAPLEFQWEDTGQREILKSWPQGRRVVRGTLAHRVLVDRVGVEAALSSPASAVEIVVQLLKDTGRALSIAGIRARLQDPRGSYCLPKQLVTKGLKGIPALLESHPSVRVIQAETTSRGMINTIPEFEFDSNADRDAAAEGPLEQQPQGVQESAHPAEDPDEPIRGNQDSLAFLAGADLPPTLDFQSLPLQSVQRRLGELDDTVLAGIRARIEDANRVDLAVLLLATPRSSRPIVSLVRDWPPEWAPGLAEGLRWLRQSGPALARVLALLARQTHSASSDVLTFVVDQLALADAEGRPSLLEIINRAEPQLLVTALTQEDLMPVLRAVNREPLANRSRLLWAAMRVRPDSVHSVHAWGREISLEDLVALSERRPEAGLLDDSWVRDELAAPRVLASVLRISSRRELAVALGWSHSLLAAVPPPELATAARRVAEQDRHIQSLLNELSSSTQVASMEASLAAATAEAENARREAQAARMAEADARAAEERSFRRAASAEREQVSASQAELRHAHIDGMMALVRTLALGARLDGGMTLAEGLDRLRAEAALAGVSLIGEPGSTDTYDPRRHELLGGERAEMVEVREPGYEFDDPGGPIVLLRAVVVPVGGG